CRTGAPALPAGDRRMDRTVHRDAGAARSRRSASRRHRPAARARGTKRCAAHGRGAARARRSVAAVARLRRPAPVDVRFRRRRCTHPESRGLMSRAQTFRRLHEPGKPLLLPNAWDAGSARLIEACGAAAIATTSAGLAWSRGYPDGNALPPRVLAAVVEEIARVLSVPLTVDSEGGYSTDPPATGDTVAPRAGAGAVGVNLEDGGGAP